jgi:thiol-disulfide isomerase/thioredoxin
MNKKYIPLIWLAVIIVIAIVVVILISTSNPKGVLKDGVILNDPYFSDKVIIIHFPSCPHCLVVVPILKEIEQENNLEFYYYDTTNRQQLDELTRLGLVVQYVPDVIIYGKVYVGERTKAEYEEAILNK